MGLKLCKGAKGMWKERYGMLKLYTHYIPAFERKIFYQLGKLDSVPFFLPFENLIIILVGYSNET